MPTILNEVAKSICSDLKLNFIGGSGEGAFKETYHVVTKEGFDIALKVFKSSKVSERTQREIEAMLICDHPNIGKLKQVTSYEYKGNTFLYSLEEFLSGGSLSEKLKKGTICIKQFHSIGDCLISALSHISSHGLVHRDIKPDNIMFRDDEKTPVIVDFGLVRDLNSESLTQTWLLHGPGSPYYSAPEQLNNQKELIDWRTDQFSLGVTFSLCLFGIHPYHRKGDNLSDVVTRIISREDCSPDFVQKCKDNGLELLQKMVSPWSVGRFRKTDQLKQAWNKVIV